MDIQASVSVGHENLRTGEAFDKPHPTPEVLLTSTASSCHQRDDRVHLGGGRRTTSGPAVGEVVVDVVEREVGRSRKADLRGDRPDLVPGEGVVLLTCLPDVDDADTAAGRGAPVEQGTGRALAARSQVHLLDHLVVLLERCSAEVHHDAHSHDALPATTADSVSAFMRPRPPFYPRPRPASTGPPAAGPVHVTGASGPSARSCHRSPSQPNRRRYRAGTAATSQTPF